MGGLQPRRPAPLWLLAAATGALGLLAGLWFMSELLLEGLEEARADVAEHAALGLLWVIPSLAWMRWRPPGSRLRAFLVIMGWVAVASMVNLVVLFRFLAEDFGLPPEVSVLLVASMSVVLLIYQALLAMAPAAVLQGLLYERVASDRRSAEALGATPRLSGAT